MASPAIVAETQSSNSASSSLFPIATGSPQPGEGVIIILSRDGGTGNVTWIDGYIELFDLNGDDGRTSGSAAYKQAGSSEPATTNVTSTVAGEFVARAFRITGHLDFSIQAPDSDTVTSDLNASIHDPPGVTVTDGPKDILALAVLPTDTHTAGINTFPAGYAGTGTTHSGTSGSQCSLSYCHLEISNVSSENPSQFEMDNTRRALPTTILIQADSVPVSSIVAGSLSLLGVGG